MKKLLLTLAAACAVTCASAAVADLTKVWSASVDNAFSADKKVFNAPVAVDAAGNLIATGAFSEDLTVAGTTLEAVGTSAYVIKYNQTGQAAWAVAFTGAASITAIDTDADGNIFVAGTFDDEVSFGTTSGEPLVRYGLMIEGAPTADNNASYIAKYNADGKILDIITFIPAPLPELVETGMYYPTGEDMYFRVSQLKVIGDKVYAAAAYTNETVQGDAMFKASYNDPWGGVFFIQLPSFSVLSVDTDLSGCVNLISCGLAEPLATEDIEYKASAVTFTVTPDAIYPVFAGNGPLTLTATAGSKTIEAEASAYNYIFVEIKDGAIAQCATFPCPESGFDTDYNPVYATVSGPGLLVAGNESYAENYGTADERISNRLFIFSALLADLASATKTLSEQIDGDINYYDVASAALLSSGELYINAKGYYTASGDGHRKGDFAGKVRSFTFSNDAFAPATTVADALGVAARGTKVAFSQITETGASFSLYNDPKAGLDDITVGDSDAPAVYYNLQGIRVANPDSGLYIVRRGNTVRKVLK